MKELIASLNGGEYSETIENRIKELYEYLNFDLEDLENDIEHDFLTENSDNLGNEYLWYADDSISVAIDVNTGKIVDEKYENESLEGILY